jgi:two-component system, response regulator PdtaR
MVLSDLRWNKNTPTALKGSVSWLERAFSVDSLALKGHGPPKTAKIVVAEDDVLMRLMLADVLRYEGFQVFEAAEANEAISILECTPDVDVVISDMRMRGIQDGLTLARYARAHCPGVSLVLASSSPPPLDTTFDAFFVKPFSPKEIVTWIKRRLGAARSQSV